MTSLVITKSDLLVALGKRYESHRMRIMNVAQNFTVMHLLVVEIFNLKHSDGKFNIATNSFS